MSEQKLLNRIAHLTTENLILSNEITSLTEQSYSLHQIIYGSKSKILNVSRDSYEFHRGFEATNILTNSSYLLPSINECIDALSDTLIANYGIDYVTVYFRNLGGSYTPEMTLDTYFNTEISNGGISKELGKGLINKMYGDHLGNLTKCNYLHLKMMHPTTTTAYTMIASSQAEPVYGIILECTRPLTESQAVTLQYMVDTYATVVQLKKKWLEVRLVCNTLVSKYTEEVETSRIDAQTRILNKVALDEFTEQFYKDKPTIIAFLDIDEFKDVNDLFGHDAGDAVLLWFATELHKSAESIGGDVFRNGGDEFLAIFTCGDVDLVKNVMTDLLDTVRSKVFQFVELVDADPNKPDLAPLPKSHSITCSIGVYHNKNVLPFDEAKAIADRVMYQAKESGKDQITIVESGELDE